MLIAYSQSRLTSYKINNLHNNCLFHNFANIPQIIETEQYYKFYFHIYSNKAEF